MTATETSEPPQLFTIGVAARAAGCSTETIRVMERRGRLPQPRRVEGRATRVYSEADIDLIRAARQALPLPRKST